MACFLVPGAEAVVVTAAALALKKKEESRQVLRPATGSVQTDEKPSVSLSRKLMWLAKLLWGGVILLCFEHLWHGEVVPFPPFLTAMYSPEDTAVMLSEMASVGGAMALWLTAVWAGILVAAKAVLGRSAKAELKA